MPITRNARPTVVATWRTLLAVLTLPFTPALAHAQVGGSERGWTYRFDLRPAEARADRLGVDFDIQYSSQEKPAAPQFDAFGLLARARGFSSFDRASRDVNALSVGATLQGWHYSSEATTGGQLRPEQLIALIPLLEKQGAGAPLTDGESALIDAFVDLASAGRRFFTYGLDYRLETTQDVSVSQHAFGATGTMELPRLGRLLDVVPSSTRSASATSRGFPVRALLAVEYVRPPQRSTPGEILVDTASWRARTEFAWSAVVFDRYVLRATWEAHYFIDPPQAVRDAGRAFNNFLEAAVSIEIADGTSVLVKYLSGRLPPTYAQAGVSALGLSFTFFPKQLGEATGDDR